MAQPVRPDEKIRLDDMPAAIAQYDRWINANGQRGEFLITAGERPILVKDSAFPVAKFDTIRYDKSYGSAPA